MIDLPIQSNLREGLSLTEYIISCYGARKGVVDIAVRTSDAGYLTHRLVEVVQHIVVRQTDCGTIRGIYVITRDGMMTEKILIQTLIGRVLADDIYIGLRSIAIRNQDIGIGLLNRFIIFQTQPIYIRTPFTCSNTSWICRLCYGWSPTHGDLVELGEVVGIIAGQSIGEPGTQLTLRTFHTGGVFTGGTAEHVRAPSNEKIKFNEDLVHPTRTRHGHPAFLCYIDLYVTIENDDIIYNIVTIPPKSFLLVQNDQYVESEQVIAEIRARTYTLNFKEKVRKHIYSDSEGEMHWRTDERDNLELKVLNYILYGNGKSIREISDTSIQLVRTCLVLNWDQNKKSSSIEKAFASFIEVSTNGFICDFIRIDLGKSHTLDIIKRNDPYGSGLIPENQSHRTNINTFDSIYSKEKIQQSLSQNHGTIRMLLNRNNKKKLRSLIILSSANYFKMLPFNDVKYHNEIKKVIQQIKRSLLIPIKNSLGPLGITIQVANLYSFYCLITHNQISITPNLQLDKLKETFPYQALL
ncbi:unnamed protein product [Lupinus luteus]|uniref:DNA-directed RNA polymerase n=1 Tax=Lupinus luteus TaxID=3873 RepID=A0AAV1Y194_LUPLU